MNQKLGGLLLILAGGLFSTQCCSAGPYYLFTADYFATAFTPETKVTYLSPDLTGAVNLLPIQVNVALAPTGFHLDPSPGQIDSNGSFLAFRDGSHDLWIYQGFLSTALSAPGTYSFAANSELSNPIDGQTPLTGTLSVQQIDNPPPAFIYTASFDASAGTGATVLQYASPIFLTSLTFPDPSLVRVLTPPAPGAQLVGPNYFALSNNVGEAFFSDGTNNFSFLWGINPGLSSLGTFAFTGVSEYLNSTPFHSPGSITVAAAPEPSTWLTIAAPLLALTLRRRRGRRTTLAG